MSGIQPIKPVFTRLTYNQSENKPFVQIKTMDNKVVKEIPPEATRRLNNTLSGMMGDILDIKA